MSLCARIGKNLFRRTLAFENVIWQRICDYSGKAKFTFQWVGNLEMLTWLVLPESWCCITASRVANVLSLSLCLNRGQVPRTRSSQSSERVDAALALLCDMTSSGGVARATRPLVTTSLEKHIENMLSCMSFIERSFRYPYLFGRSRKGRTSEKKCGITFQ